MINQRAMIPMLLVALILAATPALAELKVGHKAPELTVSHFVKGDPVTLAKARGKQVVLVEFWAVWCPPCKVSIPTLTELQQNHKDDLTIIGVTVPDERGNTLDAVKRFVKDQGDNMDYHVAFDASGATHKNYMLASGNVGIPHSFLVDYDGKIVWQGSPLDPALGEVINRVIQRTFDSVQHEKVTEMLNKLTPQLQRGNWPAVLEGLREVLKVDPHSEVAINFMFHVYVDQLNDQEALRSWAKSFIDAHQTDPLVLSRMADSLCRPTDLSQKHIDLALPAAKGAYDLTKAKPQAEITSIYALALYQIGDVNQALTLQQEAVKEARDGEKERMKAVLDYYKMCLHLQQGSDS